MTTEVLRNMLYEGASRCGGLRFVVLDEVHYLQDRVRGAVWEEVLIHLPAEVQVVCLSATVSNAEEFGEWLEATRGPTEVVIEEHGPSRSTTTTWSAASCTRCSSTGATTPSPTRP